MCQNVTVVFGFVLLRIKLAFSVTFNKGIVSVAL